MSTPKSEDTKTDAAAGAKTTSVSIRDLTKQFDDVIAVENLDLEVKEGELLVLLGPSGCGKTTTLRMVAGLERATTGRIKLDDDDVTDRPPQDRDIAMVFQNYGLYPHKTVRGNLAFPLRKTDVAEAEHSSRIDRIASMLDIEDLLEKKPASLSGGQRQRVAVGRALVREPRLLNMDEPLSNLDAKLRVQTRAEIRTLQQELGITTLYVTHDQEEAMSIADRIAILSDGQIVQIGPPEEVYECPRNEFVASFVGEPTMNFLSVVQTSTMTRLRGQIACPQLAVPDETKRIGIRPEHIHLTDETGKPLIRAKRATTRDDPTLTSPHKYDVQLVEPVGRASEITLARGDEVITARVRTLPESVYEDDMIHAAFDQEKVHQFNAAGEALR